MTFTAFEALPGDLINELTSAGLSPRDIYDHIVMALDEDLPGGSTDITTVATIPAATQARGDFGARESGIVAGLGIAALAFHVVMGDEVVIEHRVPDGTRVAPGDSVLTVSGPARGLLTAERTALNFASHLSGIATATARWVDALEGTGARVLDTRKTLPGWRALQKYAVRCGGGTNHRFSLSDMAMVKDNHIVAAGGIVEAYEAIRAAHPETPIEVEVGDLDELKLVLDAGCSWVLLDNMSTDTMAQAVAINGGRAKLEASGGLTLERAREVALTGVDYLSVGALTHSVMVFDIGLDLRTDAR
ncbi:MAG: carboxylating nicotinate-nucleotide diphosphorylase [Candidatus Dormibacteria bacterium]